VRYKIAKSDFFTLSQGGTLSLYDFRCPGIHARPREAPGLSAGSLQVARRQVTLKPPTPTITHTTQKGPHLLTGASIFSAVRAVTRRPSGRPARCGP